MSIYTWTQAEAIELCKLIEAHAPNFGCHVALTGGCLYKDEARKDCDILFYRIRQAKEIDESGLLAALKDLGFQDFRRYGWVLKAKFGLKSVDLFFPEYDDNEGYPE